MTRGFAVEVVAAVVLAACDVTLRFAGDAGDAAGAYGTDASIVDGGPTYDQGCSPTDPACEDACVGGGEGGSCDAAPACGADVCVCPAPTSYCAGSCYNLSADHNHCGDCQTSCSNGTHCKAGHCVKGNGGADGS